MIHVEMFVFKHYPTELQDILHTCNLTVVEATAITGKNVTIVWIS